MRMTGLEAFAGGKNKTCQDYRPVGRAAMQPL
jgi:hypothetical protein